MNLIGNRKTNIMMTTEYKLTCAGTDKALSDCSENELYSARAHAWSEYFYNKEDKPFNVSWADHNNDLNRLRADCGIDPIEDELRHRGLSPKPVTLFTRVDAHFSRKS